MTTGDRVNWRSSKDAFLVPGLVVKLGPKRVQIEVRELSRFGRDLVPRTKWVDARDLSRRIYPASVLREAMDMHDRGFAISVIKRLARGHATLIGVVQKDGKQVALSAISEVNAELYEFRRRQQMLGYASLAEVPAEQLDGKSERIHHYFNAVYCWARAMLNERYQDYDATASGAKRGEELAEASGDLWRDARWAISRVQDAPHCTVELI